MEILFVPLISRGSVKPLGLCAGSVPENELCELELGLVLREGVNPEFLQDVNSKNCVPFSR